jgi:sugar transferase (PEP-CTERM system associated)
MIRALAAYLPTRMLLLGATEALLVGLAFTGAILFRFGHDADLVLRYEHGLIKIALVIAVFFLSMWYLDLYDGQFLSRHFQLLPRLLQVAGVMVILLAFVYYAYPGAQIGRSVLLVGMFLALILLVSWRQMFFTFIRQLNLVQRVLVFGTGPFAVALSKEASTRPELGVDFVGCIDDLEPRYPTKTLPYMGKPTLLREVVRNNRVSRVIVALEDRRGRLPLEQLLQLKCEGIVVEEGFDFYESVTGKVPLDSLRMSWLVFSQGFRPSRVQLCTRRAISFCVAVVGLTCSLPLMLIAALAVRIDSEGPIIFPQHRVGKDGTIFTIYKFRTMRLDLDLDGGSRPAQKVDSRVTRVGRWLRRTRIDELPQLYNVVRGDMDLVGPRPFVPPQEAEFVKKIPFYRHRWAVKPGATGWAQVNRGYCATFEDNVEKLAYDLFYIKHMSVGLDLIILLQTIKIILLGRGGQ